MDAQYIEDIFSHHPPKTEDAVKAHELVRADFKTTAHFINTLLPESPEKALSIRYLQVAMMFANAAIAIYQE